MAVYFNAQTDRADVGGTAFGSAFVNSTLLGSYSVS